MQILMRKVKLETQFTRFNWNLYWIFKDTPKWFMISYCFQLKNTVALQVFIDWTVLEVEEEEPFRKSTYVVYSFKSLQNFRTNFGYIFLTLSE